MVQVAFRVFLPCCSALLLFQTWNLGSAKRSPGYGRSAEGSEAEGPPKEQAGRSSRCRPRTINVEGKQSTAQLPRKAPVTSS